MRENQTLHFNCGTSWACCVHLVGKNLFRYSCHDLLPPSPSFRSKVDVHGKQSLTGRQPWLIMSDSLACNLYWVCYITSNCIAFSNCVVDLLFHKPATVHGRMTIGHSCCYTLDVSASTYLNFLGPIAVISIMVSPYAYGNLWMGG